MAVYHLVLLQIIFLLPPIEASPCQHNCGGVYLWYPFGIGKGCYFNKWFEVSCYNSSGSRKAFLTRFDLELSHISYSLRTTAVVNIHPHSLKNISESIEVPGSPFSFSGTNNILTVFGCDNYANESTTPCHSLCTCDPSSKHDCCDFLCTLPPNHNKFDNRNISAIYPGISIPRECNKEAFMVDNEWLLSNYLTKRPALTDKERLPISLQWGKKVGRCVELYNSGKTFCSDENYCLIQLSSGNHYCLCDSQRSKGYQGCTGDLICNTTSRANCSECPSGFDRSQISYQETHCSPSRSFNEILKKNSRVKVFVIIGCSAGLGILFVTIGAWWLYKFIKRRKAIKLKQKFFKKNGGLLLKQHLSSNNEGRIEKIKLFTSKELKKATDNYNVNRILGQGGQGTVYKGMLSEGRIVAIKKSKIVAENKVEEFINEVVILSQINHRNVVKLLGCCLETEVPLLVYEFISNGTLFQLIHDQNEEFPITWEIRLRIVTEVVSVLSYLHSSASQPIYHRDVKSTNILFDDKYRAKLSDFGISRSITVDQTHLTTQVQGTLGYVDPQYFQSSQFTEKSDVYSFGVVLAELLTGQKPIRSSNIDEDRSLVAYFLRAMEEDRLFEVLDARVLKEGEKEEIMKVANITRRCLNLNGKMRPTMKEVAIELDGILEHPTKSL